MEIPRIVKKSEWKQLGKLLDTCFPGVKKRGGLYRRWPHCYDTRHMGNNFVLERDNKLVCHVGCIPRDLIVDGKKIIRMAGISGVATDPDYRGQGLMTIILDYLMKKMKDDRVAISDLGGDRYRYNHFGYEDAGQKWNIVLNKRSLENYKIKEKYNIKKYENKYSDKIVSIYNKEPMRVKRSEEYTRSLLNRVGSETWVSINARTNKWSYAVIGNDKIAVRNIIEFGTEQNDLDGLVSLLNYILKKYSNSNLEGFNICCGDNNPMLKHLFSIGCGSMLGISEMLKIVNLDLALGGYVNVMNDNLKKSGIKIQKNESMESITLQMKDTNQNATILVNKNKIKIDKNIVSKNKIILSDIEMVKLIFGLTKPGKMFELGENKRILDNIFPLPFFIYPNNSV